MCSLQIASQETLIEQLVVGLSATEYNKQQDIDRRIDKNSFTTIGVESISVGTSTYRFIIKNAVCECFSRNGKWICVLKQLPEYQTEGDTTDDAFRLLQEILHIEFQRLYAKRPFEMTEDENRRWLRLANTIDLFEYKTTTPLSYRKIGYVSYGKVSWPVRIKWIDGEIFPIDPFHVPGNLMACKPGQWIDAVVAVDPISDKIIKIDSFERISFHIPMASEAKRYWESLPKVSLPQKEWD
jgi:hypothetical protein